MLLKQRQDPGTKVSVSNLNNIKAETLLMNPKQPSVRIKTKADRGALHQKRESRIITKTVHLQPAVTANSLVMCQDIARTRRCFLSQ